MFRHLFFAALAAALVAGIAMTLVQQYRVVPLILAAETYEAGAQAHTHGAETPADHAHAAPEPAWAPADGVERTAYTVLANLLVSAGFALVLGGVSVLANLPITFANGLLWGLAGFLAVALAPALGLAPELPGMASADLPARQLWWWGTVIATAGAALLLAKSRAAPAIAAAAALVAAPHILGAPAAPESQSAVPAHLATAFAASALATAAVFWLVLGATFGRVNDWLAARETRA